MFFTQEDFRKIEQYLKLKSKRDTDFPNIEHLTESDIITIVLDNLNKKATIKDLIQFLSIDVHEISQGSIKLEHLSDELIALLSIENPSSAGDLWNTSWTLGDVLPIIL